MAKICVLAMIAVLMASAAHGLETASQQGTITGLLMVKNGGPLANGGVMFFNTATGPPPTPGKFWRVADVKASTDANGKFHVNLDAGTYYMGVIKRASGKLVGPPEEGELFLPSPDRQGVFRQYTVKPRETTNIGIVSEIVPFRLSEHESREPVTAIEGTVVDESGKPVENAIVFVFPTRDVLGKPLFVSGKTGKDGRFTVRLSEGGTYYLKARSVYGGGRPNPKEIMGLYGKKDVPYPVAVETGKTTGGIALGGFRFPERGKNNKYEKRRIEMNK